MLVDEAVTKQNLNKKEYGKSKVLILHFYDDIFQC
jgi:hypothetical protein